MNKKPDMLSKILKFIVICLLCFGLIAGIVLLIQYFIG